MKKQLPPPRRMVHDRESAAGRLLAASESAIPRPPPGARDRVFAAIEEQVRGPMRSRSARLWVPAAAAASLAVLLVFWVGGGRGARALRVEDGLVQVETAEGRAAARDGRVRLPAVVRAETSGAFIRDPEGVGLVLWPGTRAKALASERGETVRYALERGRLSVAAAPRSRSAPLEIRAGPYVVVVIGTIFEVEHVGADFVVRVHSGRVRVKGPGVATEVSSGESWSSETGPGVDPMSVAVSSALASGGAPLVALQAEERRGQELYQRGLALERSGDRERAVALYEQLVQGSGPASELALYQLGRLKGARAPGEGLELFERYRQRFPRGSLSQEVGLNLIELNVRLGRHQDARREAARFLGEFPQSERASEVRALHARMGIELGGCAAVADEIAALRGSKDSLEEGLYLSATCAAALGRDDEARELVGQYLQLFPNGGWRRELSKIVR